MRKFKPTNSRRDLLAGLCGFALTVALLDSGGLLQWAQRLDVGPLRTACLTATQTLDYAVALTGLTAIRPMALGGLARAGWSDDPAADEMAARHAPAVSLEDDPVTAADIQSSSLPLPKPVAKVVPAPVKIVAAVVPPTPVAAPVSLPPDTAYNVPLYTPLPPFHAHSTPLTIALAGDSMMAVGLSEMLFSAAYGNPNLHMIREFRAGTGLARPDAFNWMVEYPAMLHGQKPNLIIVAIGANDSQSYIENGVLYYFGGAAWEESYSARVKAYLDMITQTAAPGAQIVWIGLPPMNLPLYNRHIEQINSVTYAVVRQYPNAIWWNSSPYVGMPDGEFRWSAAFNEGGRTTYAILRQPDGIHMTEDGAALIADVIIPWIEKTSP